MVLSLKIAYRFHRSFKRHELISLVSLISIISISISICISIIVLSVINGFKYELGKRILSIIPHIEITSNNTPFTNWKTILNHITKIPDIIYADPYINISGIVEYHKKWNLINIQTINVTDDRNTYNNKLIDFIEKTSWKYFCEHKNQIILGKGIAINLNIKTGDWITVIVFHHVNSENKLFLSKRIRFEVSGILNLNSQLDANLALISLEDARNYSDNRVDIDGIAIFVNNVFDVKKLIQKIKNVFYKNIKICSWMDTYGYIYRDIQIVRVMIYLSVILIIGISCFNVIAALILSIKNKNNDITILRALGAHIILIQNIFLWYGFIIYFIASIIGVTIGVVICLNLTNISMKYTNILGIEIFPKGIYFIDFIPIMLNTWDIFLILSIVLLLGLLISWCSSLTIKNINLTRILK